MFNLYTILLTYLINCFATRADPEDPVEEVPDVDAGLCDHRRQLLSQLEFLSDDYHSAEILQGCFSLRHRQGPYTHSVIN